MRTLCLALLVGVTLAPAPARAQDEENPFVPILSRAAANDTWDWARFTEDGYRYERETIFPVFERTIDQQARWRDDATAFLDLCCRWLAGHRDGLPSDADLAKQGMVLTEDGCTDPMVVALTYMLRLRDENDWRLGEEVSAAFAALRESDYPVHRRAAAMLGLAQWHKGLSHSGRAEEIYAEAVPLIVEMLGVTPDVGLSDTLKREYRLHKLVGHVRSGMQGASLAALHEALLAADESDPWLREILLGMIEYRLAWEARGGEFWGALTEEQKQGYQEWLDSATSRLLRAHELEPTIPHAAMMLLRIANEGHRPGGRDFLYWLDQAVSARFAFADTYDESLRGLQGRWGGGPLPTLLFAEACAQTERFDTLVPYQALLGIEQLGCEIGDFETAWGDPRTVPTIDAVLQGYQAAEHSPYTPEQLADLRSSVAWRRGRFEDAMASLRVGGRGRTTEIKRTWRVRATPSDVIFESIVRSAPLAGQVEPFLGAQSPADRAAALDALERLAQDIPGVDSQEKAALLDIRARLEARWAAPGEWIEPGFDPRMPGWRPIEGDWGIWVVSPSNDAYARTGDRRFLMTFAEPVGNRVEMELVIDTAALRNGRMGLMFAYDAEQYDPAFRSVMVNPARDIVTTSAFVGGRTTIETDIPDTGRVTLRIAVWDGFVSIWLDDKHLHAGRVEGTSWQGWGDRVGVAGWTQANTTARCTGFRLRRLEAPPPELESALAEE